MVDEQLTPGALRQHAVALRTQADTSEVAATELAKLRDENDQLRAELSRPQAAGGQGVEPSEATGLATAAIILLNNIATNPNEERRRELAEKAKAHIKALAAHPPAAPALVPPANWGDDVFELWWADHMPKANRNEAWAAWLAVAPMPLSRDAADAAKYRALNTPEIAGFIGAIEREALHQRDRWGAEHDAGKTDTDWFWLVGYLAGKALSASTAEKRLHHIITTAAACLNWHAARVGAYTAMRPGIDPGAHGINGLTLGRDGGAA